MFILHYRCILMAELLCLLTDPLQVIFAIADSILHQFLPRDAMLARYNAVLVCLSVCRPLCHKPVVSKPLNIEPRK